MSRVDFNYHHDKHFKNQYRSKNTLIISIVLTCFFAFLEFFGGVFSNSLSLISDSFHMFSDVIALVISMVAIFYASKKPTNKFTYGYLRMEIISSFLNGLALALISFYIIYESFERFLNPRAIDFKTMITIAIVGLIVNIVLTLVLHHSLEEEENLNVQSAMWHFIGDLVNSIGVIIAAILIKITGIVLFDIVISIIISLVILLGAIKIMKTSTYILMEAVPDNLDVDELYKEILKVDNNIEDIHEFHLWSISEGMYSLSFHVILKKYEGVNDYILVDNITKILKEKYDIGHVTIQIENVEINKHE